jgi:hypothetical protein
MTEKKLIPVNEDETEKLIRMSGSFTEPLCLDFGRSGAAVDAGKSPWAAAMLAKWRGMVFEEGAGI